MTPTKKGIFWGSWHTPAPGTADDGEGCGGKEWQAHRVVENRLDQDLPDCLVAMVPGVEKWQPLDAFEWGGEIIRYHTEPERLKTPRDFSRYADFLDAHSARIRIQESSLDSGRRVWIFCDSPLDGNFYPPSAKPFKSAPNLTEAQAREVVAALNKFLGDAGEA